MVAEGLDLSKVNSKFLTELVLYETIAYTVGSLDTAIEQLPDADISSKTKLQKSTVLTTLESF